jgi:hypothetical protein
MMGREAHPWSFPRKVAEDLRYFREREREYKFFSLKI